MKQYNRHEPESNLRKLRWLMDYELAGASRYRRFASLILMKSKAPAPLSSNLFSGSLRASDELFELDTTVAILMGDTDRGDADVALERLRERLHETQDFEAVVVTYPADGIRTEELLNTAFERIGLRGMPRD